MTDKPIMINGVDVAGCGYLGLYKECKLKCGSCCPVDCSDNPNCYYKQLIHKEQECERLRFPMKDSNYAILTKEEFEDYKKLKQTLTEIKDICKFNFTMTTTNLLAKTILQKISEVEND